MVTFAWRPKVKFHSLLSPAVPRLALLSLVASLVITPVLAQSEPEEGTAGQANGTPEVTIDEAGLFDLHLRGVPLPDALRMLSQRARRNISVTETVTSAATTDLFQVSFEEALDALVTPAGYTWFAKDKFIYVCSPQERDTLLAANRQTELGLFELSFVTTSTVYPVVEKLLSPAGVIVSTPESPVSGVALTREDFDQALSDGLGGRSKAIGEFLLVRDYREVLDEIAEVLQRIDVRPRQVLIEAMILRVRLEDSNALGIDFNVMSGIDFRSLNSTSTGGLDLTPGAVPPRKFDGEITAAATDLSAGIGPGGASIGVITNSAAMFVRALEQMVDLTIVANPKVLTVNEQLGRVIVGREDGYLTTTVTQTTAVQNIEFLETGTQILFRPFITKDGYVRMDIHPEDSTGGLTQDNLPFKDTTEVTANVLVRDGHTLVIGGLFRDVASTSRNQIPWLGHIPIVGHLFRGDIDGAAREEVIVLITPHIIDAAEHQESAAFAMQEVERRRTLAHRALLPWGRERLALAHYNWALEHLRENHKGRAMWDLDIALSLDPGAVKASRLRDRITGEISAEPDNSAIRNLLHKSAQEDAKAEETVEMESEGHAEGAVQ